MCTCNLYSPFKMSVNSNFDCSRTSSKIDTVAITLRNHWGFANATVYYKGNEQTWIAQLKASLDQRQPIYYRGQSNDINNPPGHAWIVDGYNNNNYFHCNFGWGNRFANNYQDWDGWYLLSNIIANSINLSYQHAAILNFYPTTYSTTDFINSSIPTGTYSGHKIVIENSSVNSNANVILDPDCSTEIFGPFSVPLGSSLSIQ